MSPHHDCDEAEQHVAQLAAALHRAERAAESAGERAAKKDVPVGSTWQRNPPGREVVVVQRVWDYSALGDPATPSVRAHPKHGGRPLVAPVEWFIERYTRVIPPGSGAPC